MKDIDVRGLSCPEPLLIVKREIENNNEKSIRILISESHTVKNIEAYLNEANLKFKTSSKGFEYIIEV